MVNDDLKIFHPTEIQETPFPLSESIFQTESKAAGGGDFRPIITKENPWPAKKVAVELLSTALNTRSKKILQEFALQDSGSIQIGDFKEGISGDLRITPNGLTARDLAGITTFSIDGVSGDAIFKGIIQGRSLIAGLVVVGDNAVLIDGETGDITINSGKLTIYDEDEVSILDATGLKNSAFNFDTVFSSTIQNINNTTTDLSDMTITFTFKRETELLLMATCLTDFLFNTSTGTAKLSINVDGVDQTPQGVLSATHGSAHNTLLQVTLTTHKFVTLGAGSHTIKLRGTHSGTDTANFGDKQLTYITLGK